ncbi:hypothetical protein Ancab_025229 [Ancistrocladus abbreviatus]
MERRGSPALPRGEPGSCCLLAVNCAKRRHGLSMRRAAGFPPVLFSCFGFGRCVQVMLLHCLMVFAVIAAVQGDSPESSSLLLNLPCCGSVSGWVLGHLPPAVPSVAELSAADGAFLQGAFVLFVMSYLDCKEPSRSPTRVAFPQNLTLLDILTPQPRSGALLIHPLAILHGKAQGKTTQENSRAAQHPS